MVVIGGVESWVLDEKGDLQPASHVKVKKASSGPRDRRVKSEQIEQSKGSSQAMMRRYTGSRRGIKCKTHQPQVMYMKGL